MGNSQIRSRRNTSQVRKTETMEPANRIPRGLFRVSNPDSLFKRSRTDLHQIFSSPAILDGMLQQAIRNFYLQRIFIVKKAARVHSIHRREKPDAFDFKEPIQIWLGLRMFEPIFFQVCKNLQNVQKLSLCFELDEGKFSGDISEGLKDIGSAISKHCTQLKHFSLTICNTVNFSKKGMRSLVSSLFKHSTQLETLYLAFTEVDMIDLESFKVLGQGISSSLINLQQLTLHFEKNAFQKMSINDEGVKNFITRLSRNLTKLNKLDLSFTNYRTIQGKNWEELAACLAQNLPSLKSLKIALKECETVSDLALEQFGLGIGKHLPGLQELEFTLSSSYNFPIEKSGEGFRTLVSEISRNLKTLQRLKLELIPVRISDDDLSAAASELVQLQDLRELSLLFKSITKISDKALVGLVSNIAQNLSVLESFELEFGNSTCGVTGKGLVMIASEIAQCNVNWKEFRLKYHKSWSIREEIANQIKEMLAFIPMLSIQTR